MGLETPRLHTIALAVGDQGTTVGFIVGREGAVVARFFHSRPGVLGE